ncbi:MAG TPA: ATP-binding protein [Oligoflexus sp.]|uniref:ATP-binding protein n=1 Tax=Oligoflexus sp. TaxID=1971216 RepID=UPI002D2648E3|nr:ATP-binding protein [Oligoflexus sp.]HYX39701.1 ATP-binding protein [Oligoflexus sp.]
MQQYLANLSIKYKFFGGIATVIFAIAVFMLGYFPQNLTQLTMRGLTNESKTLSKMMAFSIVGGIEFEDTKTAEDVFKNAKSNKNLLYAMVRKVDGTVFSGFNQDLADKITIPKDMKDSYFVLDGMLHVITPVESGGDVIANLITGFSMDEIRSAERNNFLTISTITFGILVFGLVFAMFIGGKITKPIASVVAAAQKIAGGDLEQDLLVVSSKDETGQLASTFNLMVTAIRKSDSNLRSLLASLTTGIFFFDRNGMIAKERSQALSLILPDSSKHESIHAFLQGYSRIDEKTVATVLSCLWDDSGFFNPFDGTVAMLPCKAYIETENGIKHVRFEYRELFNATGDLDKVIVFVSDITEQLASEQARRLQEERIKRISMAAGNLESFREFFDEAVGLFKKIEATFIDYGAINLKVIKRDLHTLKGNTATFEFATLAEHIHELEDIVAAEEFISQPKKAIAKWEHIKDQWKFQTTDINEVLGLHKSESYVRVDRKKLAHLKETAIRRDPTWVHLLSMLELFPASEVLGKYSKLVEVLARKSGKSATVSFASDCDNVSFKELQRCDGALVHIFRNCVDHGIETFAERESLGKAASGIISVGCFRKGNMLYLVIKDDGKGIDVEKLAIKAVAAGIWTNAQAQTATFKDKINLIFTPSLSTADQITETSGRGVGMDAVRSIVQELGGQITVFSEKGVGTQFEISLPSERAVDTDQIAA